MAEAIVQAKRCNRCDAVKPLSGFSKNRSRRDGVQQYCKECWKAYSKSDHQRTMRLAQVRRYQATPKGKANAKRVDQKRSGSQQVKARARVRDRVAHGKMPAVHTLACDHCGQQACHYHHHHGYEPPNDLDVIPLCQSCHQIADA